MKKILIQMGTWFLLWEGVVVLKELILTVSTLGGCDALERTDFLTISTFRGSGQLEIFECKGFP